LLVLRAQQAQEPVWPLLGSPPQFLEKQTLRELRVLPEVSVRIRRSIRSCPSRKRLIKSCPSRLHLLMLRLYLLDCSWLDRLWQVVSWDSSIMRQQQQRCRSQPHPVHRVQALRRRFTFLCPPLYQEPWQHREQVIVFEGVEMCGSVVQ